MHFDHVELEGVLRRAALLVHHGGIGTSARAFEAGIPQVISPVLFDQPDNGHRVELLGAGKVVPRAELNGGALAAAVQASWSDPALASRLATYRATITASSAVTRAVDLLDGIARSCPRPLCRAASISS